ncbi:YchF/Obg family ATPase [Aspergillus mulundensis]|uniref:Obg-like ATPase 1 n=1 Tax=Aspergillus mulundensis TaxID=1810919 RepID=A0A3D8RQI9_9EURO|nr:hypothetical protein DSM5745_06344 [Aspergillus mulundensis]RDW76352.1 hypothetical protein DSM5745_06344 [Aspergillus mulundensis]
MSFWDQDWDPNPDASPPEEPRFVKSGKFTHDGKQIKYDDTARADLREIKRPISKSSSKPWLIAQLSLYGIAHKKSDPVATIRDVYSQAIKAKKFETPTPEMQAFEASLAEKRKQQLREHEEAVEAWRRNQFSEMATPADEARLNTNMFLAKYFCTDRKPDRTKQKDPLILEALHCSYGEHLAETAQRIPGLKVHVTNYISVIGWEGTLDGAIDAAFARLVPLGKECNFDSLTEEARFDVNRFMQKYFMREGTKDVPDTSKTGKPLKLYCSEKESNKLSEAVRRVPGLHTGYIFPYMFIGWDEREVAKQVHNIKKERLREEMQEMAEEEAREEEERAAFWKPHKDFMSTFTTSPGPLTLNDLTGSFLAHCPKIDEDWDHKDLELHIQPPSSSDAHGVVAAFHFGVMHGTMLLALSEDALHTFAEEMAHDDPDDDTTDSENEWAGCYNGNKRKAKTMSASQPQAIRRRLGEMPKPNRVYFRWAGMQEDTGDPEGHTENLENCGYLDFEPSKAVGRGKWVWSDMFGTDKKLDLEVYKVSNEVQMGGRSLCKHLVPWSHWGEAKFYKYNKKWGCVSARRQWAAVTTSFPVLLLRSRSAAGPASVSRFYCLSSSSSSASAPPLVSLSSPLLSLDFRRFASSKKKKSKMPPKKAAVQEKVLLGRPGNNLKSGIVGLANVGKSTLFQAITKSGLGNPANFPYATIDPEEAKVIVPDERFDWLCEQYKPKSKVPANLTIYDIAGLTRGASTGAGLGNAFLSHIRAVDAIFQVVRCFDDAEIIHVEGDVDPVRDLIIISEELRIKDIEFVEKALENLKKQTRRGGQSLEMKKLKEEEATTAKVLEFLQEGKNVRHGDWSPKEVEVINPLFLLTAKPVVYLVNLSEKDYIRQKNKYIPKLMEWIKTNSPGDSILPISACFEERLTQFETEAEAEEECKKLGTKSGLPKAIVQMRQVLNLASFFTTGADEVRQWTIRKNTKAPAAAGVIHGDFEKTFIQAIVYNYSVLKELGDEGAVKAAGKVMTKGKDYIVEDGDILLIKAGAARS